MKLISIETSLALLKNYICNSVPRVEAIIGKNVIERWNFMKQNTKLTKLIIARILNWISIRVEIFPFESISVRSHDTSFGNTYSSVPS